MSLHLPVRCLSIIGGTLLACSLSFFSVYMLPFTDPWMKQCAMAAAEGNRTVSDTGQADFSESEMRYVESQARELDQLTYEIILRNTGSGRLAHVELGNHLSSNAVMLISASPELAYNVGSRILHWQGIVDPGEERRFTVRLITLPGSYGNHIVSHAEIGWNGGTKSVQVETDVSLPAEVSRKKFLFVAGRIGITWLEIMIIGYLLFVPFFLIVVPRLIRQREKQRFEGDPDVAWHHQNSGRTTFKAMSIAFLLSLAVMPFLISEVVDDIRRFVSYEKTTCIILDKKAGWLPGSRGGHPTIAVRYDAGGREIVSAGSLAKGASTRGTSAEKKIAPYEVGKSYPCWFDPDDPKRFVIRRGDFTWGLYLLFLPPLVLFLISSRYFLRKVRGPNLSRMSDTPIQ